MGYEGTPERITGIDRNKEGIPLTIEGAYPEAKEILNREAIDPLNFVDLYGKDNVERDLRKVEDYEKKFSADASKKTAEVLEAVILESELHNWFGQQSEIIKTSRYDDIVNGTDMLVEFEEPGRRFSHLGVAVDVTFGTVGIDKKMGRIKQEVDRGELATVKYFYSEREHFRGERSNIPRVVIGIEHDRVVELAGLWMNDKKKELASHPAQRALLEEIAAQLEALKKYSEKIGKRELVPIYEKDLTIIKTLLDEKRRQGIKLDALKDDRVYNAIKESLARTFETEAEKK